MTAMRSDAVHGDAGAAQLRPTDAAVCADAATRVVMVHDAQPVRRFLLRDAGAARDDYAAGLVAADERLGEVAEAERLLRRARWGAVELEVRAAHARGLHLQHDLARTGRRVGEASELDLAVAEEDDAAH